LSYFHPGSISNKKQKNESIKYVVLIVGYDQDCIQKLLFLKFVRIFRLSFVIVCNFFFPKTFPRQYQTKQKKRITHIQFFPNCFNLVFLDFSPILPDFFSVEKIALSYVFPFPERIEKKKSTVVSIVSYEYYFFNLSEFSHFPL
jgi:hypothetical protein